MDEKTMIFICVYPFNQDYAKKYGFEYLKKRGYDLIILNVMNILYPHAANELPHYLQLEPVNGIKQEMIETIKQLEKFLDRIKSKKLAFLVCQPEMKILEQLKLKKIDYILFINHVIDIQLNYSADLRLKKLLYEQNSILKLLLRIFKKFVSKLKKNINLNNEFYHPRFIMTRNDNIKIPFDKNVTSPIYVNSFDYDRTLENALDPRPDYLPKDKYYVLLVNHPWPIHDYKLLGNQSFINKESYSMIINCFLCMLENKTGNNVLIAAYPKATEDENIYKGRPFIYDTEKLVKYSAGVISHHTGAINFAVIYKKPICLIGLRAFPNFSEFYLYNKIYSKELGVPLRNIDTEDDCHSLLNGEIFSINRDAYREYMGKHIHSKFDHNKRVWSVVSDALENNYWNSKNSPNQ